MPGVFCLRRAAATVEMAASKNSVRVFILSLRSSGLIRRFRFQINEQ
jgi:hypothetical protein